MVETLERYAWERIIYTLGIHWSFPDAAEKITIGPWTFWTEREHPDLPHSSTILCIKGPLDKGDIEALDSILPIDKEDVKKLCNMSPRGYIGSEGDVHRFYYETYIEL